MDTPRPSPRTKWTRARRRAIDAGRGAQARAGPAAVEGDGGGSGGGEAEEVVTLCVAPRDVAQESMEARQLREADGGDPDFERIIEAEAAAAAAAEEEARAAAAAAAARAAAEEAAARELAAPRAKASALKAARAGVGAMDAMFGAVQRGAVLRRLRGAGAWRDAGPVPSAADSDRAPRQLPGPRDALKDAPAESGGPSRARSRAGSASPAASLPRRCPLARGLPAAALRARPPARAEGE